MGREVRDFCKWDVLIKVKKRSILTETKEITAQDIVAFCSRQGLALPAFTIIEVVGKDGEKTQTNPLVDIFERLIEIQLLVEAIEEMSEAENTRRYREEILPLQEQLKLDYPVLTTSSLGSAKSKSTNLSILLSYVRKAMNSE